MSNFNSSPVRVLVRLCGRNRVRIAHGFRTDGNGVLWATIRGCGRNRERIVLAMG